MSDKVAFVDEGAELGTTWSAVIVAEAHAEREARVALMAARRRVRELEDVLSEWREGSHVSDVNRRASAVEVALDPVLRHILGGALHVARVTDGAFDVTWRTLAAVWASAALRGVPPRDDELAPLLRAVGPDQVRLGPGGVRLGHRDTRLGIAGIAKGFIIDEAFHVLRRAGFGEVIVNIGGDLRTSGRDPQGLRHVIRVADPFRQAGHGADEGRARDVAAVFQIEDAAVATTGNYLRYHLVGDRRFGHNLDPRTGRPPAFDGSVTVLTRDAAMADALATALFVMGPERGLAFVAKTPGVEALFVTRAGIRTSADLRAAFDESSP